MSLIENEWKHFGKISLTSIMNNGVSIECSSFQNVTNFNEYYF